MSRRGWTTYLKAAILGAAIIALALLPCSAPPAAWRVYAFRHGSFYSRGFVSFDLPATWPSPPPHTPPTWRVTASTLADVTGDGQPEWVLLVWRPWADWPVQRWATAPSPIAGFHDAAGDSCHLILLDPRDGRDVWAGSALPAPLVALAVGDVDGDGQNEVVALEGDYAAGQDGPAAHVNVWGWNGFGFSLEWRSPPGAWRQLHLTRAQDDSILVMVR